MIRNLNKNFWKKTQEKSLYDLVLNKSILDMTAKVGSLVKSWLHLICALVL